MLEFLLRSDWTLAASGGADYEYHITLNVEPRTFEPKLSTYDYL
jgi:hypothetical protein